MTAKSFVTRDGGTGRTPLPSHVAQRAPLGWTATTVPETTAGRYAAVLDGLDAALILWRRAEQATGGRTRSRNLLACTCPCGRRLRTARRTLAEAPILCGACEGEFTTADNEPV